LLIPEFTQMYGPPGSPRQIPHLNYVSQDIDPTLELVFRPQFVVDDRRCVVELLLPYYTGTPNPCASNDPRRASSGSDAVLPNPGASTADALALVYSITSRASFEHIRKFAQQEATKAKSEGCPVVVVVGNKCDKDYAREVAKEEGAELARKAGCDFVETSAKTGQNVERVLANLVRSLRGTRLAVFSADGSPQEKKRCVTL
jgi:GTPase KRas protein